MFIDAFYDLTTERNLVDLCPIPWSKIKEYADEYGFAGEIREDLYRYIREMDVAYITQQANKQKRK